MKATKPNISSTAKEWLLPFNRGFVIQIEAHADLSANGFCGRVEHMASGRATHFYGQDELLCFLEWNLKGVAQQASLITGDSDDCFNQPS